MRNPVIERILKDMKKDPWYIKLRRWYRVEMWCVRAMGFKKYAKHNLKRLFKKKK